MSVFRITKKFGKILSSHQKLRIIEMTVLMILGGFLEMLSVSLMMPFINVVMNPEKMMQKWYIKTFCNILHIHSSQTFLAVLAVVLAVIYILKNMYLMAEYNIQYRFVYRNMFMMQRQLLQNFIYRPYEYFLNADSGEVMRIVGSDTSSSFNLLTTLLGMLTELIVSFMLIAAIFIISPVTTICMALALTGMLLTINYAIRPVLRKASLDNQKASAGMYKWLLQSIEGIKELKVMNTQDYFLDNYSRYGDILVRTSHKNQTLAIFPRFFIEAASMGIVFLAVGLLIYRGSSLEILMPVLTTVAMAAIRLLPSINRISGALSAIAFNEPMLDNLITTLEGLGEDEYVRENVYEHAAEKERRTVVPLQKEIDFQRITYHYPNSSVRVLDQACMKIMYGESVGVIGSSGAGKTTAVDIILGLLCPQKGQVLIDGVDIRQNMEGWLSQIGYIPQMIFMLDGSIRENIAFGEERKQVKDSDVWRALEQASLSDFVKSLPEGLDTEIGERGIRISGGQRQRIGIARALYRNPGVLVFDEATSALDQETEASIMESIQRLHGKKTMIIIAHRLSTIEACDHVYRVEDGKIVPG